MVKRISRQRHKKYKIKTTKYKKTQEYFRNTLLNGEFCYKQKNLN